MIVKRSIATRFIGALAVTMCALAGAAARADQRPGDSPDYGQPFAQVWRIRGEVVVASPDGASRRLTEGSKIAVGESVRTLPNSEVVLRTQDQGIIALRPNSEFSAESYSARQNADDRQSLLLLKGALRIVSGWIARINPDRYRLATPTATIGVRGTDHETYVLDAASATGGNLPGTYDKVNRGGTLLEANGGHVAIDSGKVGFARDPESVRFRTRALMTLLLPVILDKVPDFFVPGRFDGEIERLSGEPDGKAAPTPLAPAAGDRDGSPRPALPAGCSPAKVGRQWLAVLDDALVRRDADTVLALFSPEIQARTVVRLANGEPSTQVFGRDELVQSTIRSLAGLTDYRQERLNTTIRALSKPARGECAGVAVRSEVIESGTLNGEPYRMRAIEEYVLQHKDGRWTAIEATSTQQ